MKTRALWSGLCLTAMLLAEGTVKAIPTQAPSHQLVLTENSPTSLTVTFDGSSTGIDVINTSNDNWRVFLQDTYASADWIEPDNSRSVNAILSDGNGFGFASSDNSIIEPGGVADGTTVRFGTDTLDNVPIFATFNDKAAMAETPEPSTVALFGVGLTGIGFVCRKISRNPVTLA